MQSFWFSDFNLFIICISCSKSCSKGNKMSTQPTGKKKWLSSIGKIMVLLLHEILLVFADDVLLISCVEMLYAVLCNVCVCMCVWAVLFVIKKKNNLEYIWFFVILSHFSWLVIFESKSTKMYINTLLL